MRLLLAQLNPTVGDLEGNCRSILAALGYARQQEADLVLFPELAICGYPPEDLLLLPHFVDACEKVLEAIAPLTKGLTAVVGTVRHNRFETGAPLHNSAAIFEDGELTGFYDKQLLPTYDVFDEQRYFSPGTVSPVFQLCGQKVGITICEDIWENNERSYGNDPLDQIKDEGVDLLLNLSASPFDADKTQLRKRICLSSAIGLNCPVAQCNQVGGNDSLIFSGHSLIVAPEPEQGIIGEGFQEDLILWETTEPLPEFTWEPDPMEELYNALVLGLKDYFKKLGFPKACFGLSGGIDSALVAVIAQQALGKENVLALLMPSRFSSKGSLSDSYLLAERLGIETKEISIEKPFQSFLDLLDPHWEEGSPGVTEENLQARIRGMILMAFSNKLGYVVLSTGNKSEMAMGYSTLYGDMCGGLSVINDVSKEAVYELARWINREQEIIPEAILTKPPSAELRPDQKDSDSLPDYSIVDSVLERYVEQHHSPGKIAEEEGISLEVVHELIGKIHRNEYKRRQAPIGLRVTRKAFSAGRRFPIVQRWVK